MGLSRIIDSLEENANNYNELPHQVAEDVIWIDSADEFVDEEDAISTSPSLSDGEDVISISSSLSDGEYEEENNHPPNPIAVANGIIEGGSGSEEDIISISSCSSDEEGDEEEENNCPPDLNIEDDENISGFSFHPSKNLIAIGTSFGYIDIYKYSNKKNSLLRTLTSDAHSNSIKFIHYNDTGNDVYSVCGNNIVSVNDVEAGRNKFEFRNAHTGMNSITSLSLIDKNTFATGDKDGVVKVWDIRANGCRFLLKNTEGSINSMVSISNNINSSPTLACASSDGTISIIGISTRKMIIQSEPYRCSLNSLIFMKRKSKLVCGTSNGSLITFKNGDFNNYDQNLQCFDQNVIVNKLVPLTEDIVMSVLNNGKIGCTHLFEHYEHSILQNDQNISIDQMDISGNGHFIAFSYVSSNVIKFYKTDHIRNTFSSWSI